jgi:hypothetical protein
LEARVLFSTPITLTSVLLQQRLKDERLLSVEVDEVLIDCLMLPRNKVMEINYLQGRMERGGHGLLKKFHMGPSCLTLQGPARRPSAGWPSAGWPSAGRVAIFYLFGHPMPYAYDHLNELCTRDFLEALCTGLDSNLVFILNQEDVVTILRTFILEFILNRFSSFQKHHLIPKRNKIQ